MPLCIPGHGQSSTFYGYVQPVFTSCNLYYAICLRFCMLYVIIVYWGRVRASAAQLDCDVTWPTAEPVCFCLCT